jgi:hypothetical protein
MKISEEEFELANRRGDALRSRCEGGATQVTYEPKSAHLVVVLASGQGIAFPASAFHALAAATPEQLQHSKISPSGLGIHFPELDVDLYLPALLERFPPQELS